MCSAIVINLTPLNVSIGINVLQLALCIYVWRARHRESLYNKLTTWYAATFFIIALGSPIVASMSSLKSWDELTGIQWFVMGWAIAVNAANTMAAFITQAAKRVREGEGIIPNGNGQKKELTSGEDKA